MSGSVTFAAGQTSKSIAVPVNGDRLGEENETFVVNLSLAAGTAALGDSQGLGTILDDEPRISIDSVTKNEGNAGTTKFVFTVSLSAASDAAVTREFCDGSRFCANHRKTSPRTRARSTFAAGQTTQTITVLVKGDRTREAQEVFYVNLSGATGGYIIQNWGMNMYGTGSSGTTTKISAGARGARAPAPSLRRERWSEAASPSDESVIAASTAGRLAPIDGGGISSIAARQRGGDKRLQRDAEPRGADQERARGLDFARQRHVLVEDTHRAAGRLGFLRRHVDEVQAVVGVKTDTGDEQVRGPGDEPGIGVRKRRTDVDIGDRLEDILSGPLQLDSRVNEQHLLDLALELRLPVIRLWISVRTGPSIGQLEAAPGGARRHDGLAAHADRPIPT